jgi:hypothetical protein
VEKKLMGYNRFRKSASRVKDRKSQNRGYSDRPAWAVNNFTMDAGERPGKIRVLDPGDEGFFPIDYHRVGGREQTCTCDIPAFNGRCVYCYYYDQADRDTHDRNNLYQRFRWIIELIDFRFGHEITEKREDGGDRKIVARCLSDDSIPKFKRGRQCPHCASGVERVFGGHKIWTLTSKQFEPFRNLDAQLQQTAYKVENEGTDEEKIILLESYTTGFICANCGDACVIEYKGEDLQLDEKAVGKLGNDDPGLLEEWASEEYECPGCGHTGEPVEEWVAVDDDNNEYEGCERVTLFDQSLKVTCSAIQRGKKTYRDYNYNESEYAMCHVLEELEGYGFSDEELEELLKPWDLWHMNRPQWIDPNNEKYKDDEDAYVAAVLESQAKTLQQARSDEKGVHYPNPYAEQKATQTARSKDRISRFRGR